MKKSKKRKSVKKKKSPKKYRRDGENSESPRNSESESSSFDLHSQIDDAYKLNTTIMDNERQNEKFKLERRIEERKSKTKNKKEAERQLLRERFQKNLSDICVRRTKKAKSVDNIIENFVKEMNDLKMIDMENEIKNLINCKIAINETDESKEDKITPLMFAIENENFMTANELLNNKYIDLTIKSDIKGYTALMYAAWFRNLPLIMLILDKAPSKVELINMTDNMGYNAYLHSFYPHESAVGHDENMVEITELLKPKKVENVFTKIKNLLGFKQKVIPH